MILFRALKRNLQRRQIIKALFASVLGLWAINETKPKNAFRYGYYIREYEDDRLYFLKNPPRVAKGTALIKLKDLPKKKLVKVDLPQGQLNLYRVSPVNQLGKAIFCFGVYCPHTWEYMDDPIIIEHKIHSNHTLFEYDLVTGETKFSLDWLPVYQVKIVDGVIVAAENFPIVPSVLPGPKKPESGDYNNYLLMGDNCGTALLTNFIRFKGDSGKINIFKRKNESFSYSKGKKLPPGVSAEEIDNEFYKKMYVRIIEYDRILETVQLDFQHINDFTIFFEQNGKKESIMFSYLFASGSHAPGIPKDFLAHGIDPQYLFYLRKSPLSSMGLPPGNQKPVLHLQSDVLVHIKEAAERRNDFSAIYLYSDLHQPREVLAEWLDSKFGIVIKPRKDFAAQYGSFSHNVDSHIFATDSQDSTFFEEASLVSDTPFTGENYHTLKCNFSGSCRFLYGLGSFYPVAVMNGYRRTTLDNEVVNQAYVLGRNLFNFGDVIKDLPIDVAEIDGIKVGVLGEFSNCDVLHQEWEGGDSELMELCIGKMGHFKGAKGVGKGTMKKILLLRYANRFSQMPKYQKYWLNKDLYQDLEPLIEFKLENKKLKYYSNMY